MEVGRRGAGIEPQGAEEGLGGAPEPGVALGRVGQGLGPALEPGPAEIGGHGRVPGPDGVGPAEDAKPGLETGGDGPALPAEVGVGGDRGLERGQKDQAGEREDLGLHGGPQLLR